MIAYTGAGASASMRARCRAAGLGTMACPRDFAGTPRPRNVARRAAAWKPAPWALDNGVFELFQRGERFEGAPRAHWELLVYALSDAVEASLQPPDWCVLPDVVGQGRASLRRSMEALDWWQAAPLRWALVVQDGMSPGDLPWDAPWSVLFVGGTLEWKLETGGAWVTAAHEHGRPCHVGRVGTAERVRWARRIGADSIDSCQPLWSVEHLERFLAAFREGPDQLGPLFAHV